jgi:uncharacterized glyoxalase superfamily protein PhnB
MARGRRHAIGFVEHAYGRARLTIRGAWLTIKGSDELADPHPDRMTQDASRSAEGVPRAQPESLRATALGASLTVKDLEKSLAWYRDALGFTVDQTHERNGKPFAVSLKAGLVRILLNQDDGAQGWDRTKGAGFSLQITTGQSVDDVASRVRKAGGTLDSEPTDMPWGARAFRLRDPDGFRLVISSERPDR